VLTEPGRLICLVLLILFILSGCGPREVQEPSQALFRLPQGRIPPLLDDLDSVSLEKCVQGSIQYFQSLPQDRLVVYGPDSYPVSHIVSSLETFLDILKKAKSPEELNRLVSSMFHVYQSVGRGWKRQVLFTGYYEPVVDGSLIQDAAHPYPLYRRPDDLVEVRLGLFNPRFEGERIIGRLEGQKLVPYYTREEIDGKGALRGRGFEIAWISNRVDRHFLQIQGSGLVRMSDGTYLRVNYDAGNGRPYRSIGRFLMEQGKMSGKNMSMQGIRSYLDAHPEQLDGVLFHDPSYVFFRIVDTGPLGNIDVPLTGGRSIATDARLFPKGGLAFIVTKKPVINERCEITEWKPFSRFVVNQDTGGAIRGPARADLFWGEGEIAEISAGHMKQEGKLFFLAAK